MAGIAPLIAKWLPARSATIGVTDEDDTITVTVADAGVVKSRRLQDQGGRASRYGAGVHQRPRHEGGRPGAECKPMDRSGPASIRNEVRRPGRIQ